MPTVLLATADISLWSDPASTLLHLPNITSISPQEQYDSAFVAFEGDGGAPTMFTGEGNTRQTDYSVEYPDDEQSDAAALIRLLRKAIQSEDSRLLIRRNDWTAEGASDLEVVGVASWQAVPQPEGGVQISFSATHVWYTVAAS